MEQDVDNDGGVDQVSLWCTVTDSLWCTACTLQQTVHLYATYCASLLVHTAGGVDLIGAPSWVCCLLVRPLGYAVCWCALFLVCTLLVYYCLLVRPLGYAVCRCALFLVCTLLVYYCLLVHPLGCTVCWYTLFLVCTLFVYCLLVPLGVLSVGVHPLWCALSLCIVCW